MEQARDKIEREVQRREKREIEREADAFFLQHVRVSKFFMPSTSTFAPPLLSFHFPHL